jgi:hypothetical protein
MSENNTPTNEDASNPDSAAGSDYIDVLDTSGAGGPFIPRPPGTGPGDPPHTGGGSGPHPKPQPPPPPAEDFIIEVELAPGVEDIAFLSGLTPLESTGGGAPDEPEFTKIARTYGLIEARPVFTREQVERDEARISALRNESRAPENRGGPESAGAQLNERDQLPPLSRFVRLRFPPSASPRAILTQLNALPQVRRAAVVPRTAPPAIPSDPMIGSSGSSLSPDAKGIERQWYLHRTRVKQAWQITRGAGVVIADVDWGFMTTHRDLTGAIERTYNAVDGSNDVTHGPERPHGTAVLGLAGARADGFGLAGYAPDTALWAIQGDSAVGAAQFDEPWCEAIDYVIRTSAEARRKVIIVEVQTEYGGNYEQVPSFHRAILAAIAADCVVCVAAGNGPRRADQDDYGIPFEPTGSILVGATDFELNLRSWFSNHGPTVDVSAPGDAEHDVTCGEFDNGVVVNNAYRNQFGGTSGAAAKVAGAAALMLAANPKLSHSEVREILKTTGSPLDTDEPIGKFLNTEAAVLEAHRRFEEL